MATLQDLLNSGMSRDEINALLSQSSMSTDGFQGQPESPQPDIRQQYGQPLQDTLASMRGTPQSDYEPQQQTMAQFFQNPQPPRNPMYDQPEPQPRQFTVSPEDGLQRLNERPGSVEQAQMNTIRNNTTGEVTNLPSSGRRSHDVYTDGPQVLKEFQNPDGTIERIVKKPTTDGFGRQTTVLVRETVTPDYLNPAMIQRQKYEKGQAELAQLQAKPQTETAQQKLANEIIAAEARSKLPYTAEGARIAEQKRADAKAKAGEEGKALPISAAKGLMENQQNLRRAQEAQALLNGQNVGKAVGDKEATGWKGYAPDAMLQRLDPAGIDTRAAIADLGSLVIHDRSGAAVTAMEFPRLRPFIPSDKDDPATARKKLNRFVMEYQNIVDEAAGFYKESGYKVPTEKLKQADVKRQTNDGVPPMETWVAKAKELNPNMSGAEIEAEYMKKYRR